MFDANFYDVDTDEEYWLSGPHRDRRDTRYSSIRASIDDDARSACEAFLKGARSQVVSMAERTVLPQRGRMVSCAAPRDPAGAPRGRGLLGRHLPPDRRHGRRWLAASHSSWTTQGAAACTSVPAKSADSDW
jgi:hypothetical protein